jgi:two-component system, chemotaxis family, sensor kinase Cph1
MTDQIASGFLDECEREQLHRLQAIQPDGALLGGNTGDPCIRLASATLVDWIGQDAAALLGQPLTRLLPDFPPTADLADVGADQDAWTRPGPKRLYPALFEGPCGSLDGLLSCNEANWLIEFEPSLPTSLRHEAYRPVPHQLYRMPHTEADWIRHCQYVADELRGASGFGRVMIYRFREDECGEVISESLADGLDPYLGLRYPASDIPQIARRLYLANRHRQIPDVDAVEVPVLGHQGAVADLGLSDLRAVSPVHLEYLRNMGVTASLSFSLVLGNRLWGLIACHHSRPRRLPLPIRERCAEIAQIFALSISGYQSTRRLLEVGESDHDISLLIDALRRIDAGAPYDGQPADGAPTLGETLLGLVGAGGAALVDGRTLVTFGLTPDTEEIHAQLGWLRESIREPVFATDGLAQLFPAAARCAERASGLLAVRASSFDGAGEQAFLWWRPEQPRTVHWAGDPRKSAQFDVRQQRLSPRSSFERWVETTTGHAEPWSDTDLLRARKFRSLVLRDINAKLLAR